jgi:hypothetical protein
MMSVGLFNLLMQHYLDNFITERPICSTNWNMAVSRRAIGPEEGGS